MELTLTKKQAEYVKNANRRWNFAVGAVRSGKSHLACMYTIPKGIMEGAGKKGINLILGATRDTIERNVLTPMREMYGPAMVGEIRGSNLTKLFGESTYCIGAESKGQISKIRGSEVKFCYIDEVCDVSEGVFDMLKSRLSLPYSECHAACNPMGPGHYVKKFIDQKGIDLYYQHYTIFDNPFLPQEYVDNICQEYAGTVYYKRYILGEWAMAEGLIYPMYEEAIDKRPEGTPTQYCVSCDYGTQNAFAALLWAKYGDAWYAVDEYYYSGRDTGVQKTDEEYAQALDAWLAEYFEGKPPRIRTIIDPSAASFITLLRKRSGYNVMHAANAVTDGIRETATCMRNGRVKITERCKSLIKELQGYVWDDKAEDDRPVKINDHACDALRYFVFTMRIAKVTSNYSSVFGG